MKVCCAVLAGILSVSTGARADFPSRGQPSLVLCEDENPHPPYVLKDGSGTAMSLVKAAAAKLNIAISMHSAPLNRCFEELRAGVSDAYPGLANTRTTSERLHIPRKNGNPDTSRAMDMARISVFRRTGDTVDWDGKRFSGLTGPVLYPSSHTLLRERIRKLNVLADEKGKNLENNFLKLLAGRGAAVIGFDAPGRSLLSQSRFAGKIEVLPIPFATEYYYLAVTDLYYSEHARLVKSMWNVLKEVRESPEYREYHRQKMVEVPAQSSVCTKLFLHYFTFSERYTD